MTNFLLLILFLAVPGFTEVPAYATFQGKDATFQGFEDDSGGFYLVWTDQGAENHSKLLVQHFSSAGKTLWGASSGILVTDRLVSPKDWIGLAGGNGDLLLSWNEPEGAFFHRLRSDGSTRREGALHLSMSTAYQPQAAQDATGGTVVVWRETLATGESVIKVQRISTAGKILWQNGGIHINRRYSSQSNPRLVGDNMSGLIVAWRDEVNQASEMRVQRVDLFGLPLWGPEGLKVYAPVGKSEFALMAPLKTGEVVLAWTAPEGQVNQIYLQKVGPKAKLAWDTKKLGSKASIPFHRWQPDIAADEEGGTWIAWEDFRDEVNYQIFVNHLQSDGSSTWPGGEIAAGPAAGSQGKFSMTPDGNQGVWLAWIDNRMATIGVYAQRADRAGALSMGASGQLVQKKLQNPSKPQILSIAPGKAVVIWADEPKKKPANLYWSLL